ncbi:tyrosine-type recombinase/integrase [Thioalkalivibrio sp.]|uniref:tyrosine-type recombinase/integrase n=1 Tax=Thioalkalivibrio sp. TaxID=2093813 RepID=UPI0035618E5C
MARPQAITYGGRTRYRVQIRKLTRGINITEYFDRKREADAFIREVENAIREGRPITSNVTQARTTFAEAVEAYLKDPGALSTSKRRALKPTAAADRKVRLKWLRDHCFGTVALKRLTFEVIDAKLTEQAQERGWSPATRYRYETTLSRLFDYCKKHGWVAVNPLNGAERLNDAKARRRTYTDAEWQALLEAADARNDMLGMFLRLAWSTGARKGELLNLRWCDIEPAADESLGAKIWLHDVKNHEPRTVFIDTATYALLQAHEQEYRKPSSVLVFPSRTRRGRYAVDQPFREAREAAKLDAPDPKYGEVLTIHHIRHTWGTRLGERGATLAQLMAAGGWKTPGMVARYMKRREQQAAEAAMLLAGAREGM